MYDLPQLLWGVNSILIVILGFMVRNWMSGISKKLGCKQDKTVCQERHPGLLKDMDAIYKHYHPLTEGKEKTGGVLLS